MKKCFKCGQMKPLSEYYKHSEMADGHLNKCKECTKKDVQKNRRKNIKYYREYDRKRFKTQKRKEAHNKRCPIYRKNNPEKYKAHNLVNSAIGCGRLRRPEYCQDCGKKHRYIHAHHEDYSRPLDVIWLCPPCHAKRHKEKQVVG